MPEIIIFSCSKIPISAPLRFFLIEADVLREMIQVAIEERRNIQACISDLEKSDFFGAISLFERSERTNSVTAITDSCLIEIDGQMLGAYFDNNPAQGYLFFKQRLKNTDQSND